MSGGELAREAGSSQPYEKIVRLTFAVSQSVTICHGLKGGDTLSPLRQTLDADLRNFQSDQLEARPRGR